MTALLHIGTDVDAEIEDAFNAWCEEHVTANLALPGFRSARRLRRQTSYAGVGEAPAYLTLYDLDDASALSSDAYAAHDQSLPEAFTGRIRFTRSVYEEIGVHEGAGAGREGSALLHVGVDVDRDYTDEFIAWYAGVHVPAVLEAPGMLGARRFQNVELAGGAPLPAGQCAYCTLYEMESADAMVRPEMAEAARKGACPPGLEPHRRATNHVYEEFFRAPAR